MLRGRVREHREARHGDPELGERMLFGECTRGRGDRGEIAFDQRLI
jgi:hypothetical protein